MELPIKKIRQLILLLLACLLILPSEYVNGATYIMDYKFCRSVMNSSPFDPIDIKSNFSRADVVVISWVKLGTVTSPGTAYWEWISPDGEKEYTYNVFVRDPRTTEWKYWSWYVVQCPYASATLKPGTWKVKFYFAGKLQFEDEFTVYLDPESLQQILIKIEIHPDTVSKQIDLTKFQFDWIAGTTFTSTLPTEINMGENHRFILNTSSNIDPQSGNISIIPYADLVIPIQYEEQYKLLVYSDLGIVNGSGWYARDTFADYSLKREEHENTSILYNERTIFTGWSGDINETEMYGQILMDEPKVLKTNWITEKTLNPQIIPIIIVGIVLVTVPITVKLSKHRRRRSDYVKEKRYGHYLENLDKLKNIGRISEDVYLKLKHEYENRLKRSN